jgi:hypothetical protein
MFTDELTSRCIVEYADKFNKRIKYDKALNILKDWRSATWALQRIGDYRR